MATIYYVQATVGNDVNDGLSTAGAFLTISKGASVAVAGDTIKVLSGSYQGSIYLNSANANNGTSASPIELVSPVQWKAVIKPLSAVANGSGNQACLEVRRDWWIINGFEVDGTAGYTGTTWTIGGSEWIIGIYLTGSRIVCKRNKVHKIAYSDIAQSNGNGGAGIALENFYNNASSQTVDSNTCYDIGQYGDAHTTIHGIYIENPNSIVQNNICHTVQSDGITSYHSANAFTIVNNTCFHCGSVGFLIASTAAGGASNCRIFNNIAYDNVTNGIVENNTIGTGNQYGYNMSVFNGNLGQNNWSLIGSTHTSDVSGSPSFINYVAAGGGNYHLSSSSTCKDTGVISLGGSLAPVTDFDGVTRPFNGSWDLGAYEFETPTNLVSPPAGRLQFLNR